MVDGVPLGFKVEARFIGPRVRIVESAVDYGLQKINGMAKFRLNLENPSPIPAEVSIKNARDEVLNASYSVVGTQLPTNVRTFLP